MDPQWSETCWSTFKYFIILIVSTYYILCISWVIKCLIIIYARCRHEDRCSVIVPRLLFWNLPSIMAGEKCRLLNFGVLFQNIRNYDARDVNSKSQPRLLLLLLQVSLPYLVNMWLPHSSQIVFPGFCFWISLWKLHVLKIGTLKKMFVFLWCFVLFLLSASLFLFLCASFLLSRLIMVMIYFLSSVAKMKVLFSFKTCLFPSPLYC